MPVEMINSYLMGTLALPVSKNIWQGLEELTLYHAVSNDTDDMNSITSRIHIS